MIVIHRVMLDVWVSRLGVGGRARTLPKGERNEEEKKEVEIIRVREKCWTV